MVRSADSVDQNHQIIMKTNLSTYLYLILSRIHRIHRELGKMRCQQILWRPLLRRPFLVTISSGDLRYPCSPQFSHADHSWFVAKKETFEHTDLYIHNVQKKELRNSFRFTIQNGAIFLEQNPPLSCHDPLGSPGGSPRWGEMEISWDIVSYEMISL